MRGTFGKPGVPFLLSRRAHLLTTQKGRWYCLRQPCALRGGCGSCGSLMSNATPLRRCCHWPRSRLFVLLHHQNSCFRFGNTPPPASEKHQPDVFTAMGIACRNTHFLFAKKKQKARNERTVKTNGNLSSGSQSGQPGNGAFCRGSFRLSELYQYSQ